MNATEMVPSEADVSSAHTAEIDVELSDSDTEQKPKEKQKEISSMSDCDRPADNGDQPSMGKSFSSNLVSRTTTQFAAKINYVIMTVSRNRSISQTSIV